MPWKHPTLGRMRSTLRNFKSTAHLAGRRLGVDVSLTSRDRLKRLTHDQWTLELLERQLADDPLLRAFFRYLIDLPEPSNSSRLLTDRLAHWLLGDDRYYVEIGAWDPIRDSDTYWLEHLHGWQGIQVEPNPHYAASLRQHRVSLVVEAGIVPSARASGGFWLQGSDDTAFVSESISSVPVRVMTLRDVFSLATQHVDALFLDIEGSEAHVLGEIRLDDIGVDFASVETIKCRDEVVDLMRASGYTELWRWLSGYNSWFVRSSLLAEMRPTLV